MEEAVYLANILREANCALCGAARRSRTLPRDTRCAICGTQSAAKDAIFAIGLRAARPACSPECLEVLLREGLVDGSVCPMCGAAWSEARPLAGTCVMCAAALHLDAGFAGLWRVGRLQRLCGASCLGAFLRRANPFCG